MLKKLCVSWLLASALLGSAWADDAPGTASAATLNKVLSGFAARQLVMMYRQETATAPNRLDPTIQATTAALQHEFLDRHFKLTQPSPAALTAMDRGPDVIVSFAPDAGMSMIYSVYSDVRPLGAPDMGMAEIRISAQVFIGSSLWWLLLSAVAARARRYMNLTVLSAINRASGAVIIAFGLHALARAMAL